MIVSGSTVCEVMHKMVFLGRSWSRLQFRGQLNIEEHTTYSILMIFSCGSMKQEQTEEINFANLVMLLGDNQLFANSSLLKEPESLPLLPDGVEAHELSVGSTNSSEET